MPSSSGPCAIQVTNISPAVTKDQLTAFFGFIGNISGLQMYPDQEDSRFPSKIAYVKFSESDSVDIALHLQNTVFNDRALFIQPFKLEKDTKFPSEKEALSMIAPQEAVFGILPKTKSWPVKVVNLVVGQAPNQQIVTIDPKLDELGFPSYPPLNYEETDTSRIEDIRKTIYVSNLDSSLTCEQLIAFFKKAGDVRCARITVFGPDNIRGCYIEFYDQSSISEALQLNGSTIGNAVVQVDHATQAIDRGRDDQNDDSNSASSVSDTLEDGMRRMRAAHAQINRGVEEEMAGGSTKTAKLANASSAAPVPVRRQRSPGRSSSRSRSKRSRSKSKHRSDRHRSKRSRSRSRDRRRRSGDKRKDRKRSKSRSNSRERKKERKRSKSRDKRDRSRDRKSKKDRKSSRDRSRSRDRRRKKDDKKERKSKRSRSRSRDREPKKTRRRSRSRTKTVTEKTKGPTDADYKNPGDEPHEPEQLECTEPIVESVKQPAASEDNRVEVPMDTSSTSNSSD